MVCLSPLEYKLSDVRDLICLIQPLIILGTQSALLKRVADRPNVTSARTEVGERCFGSSQEPELIFYMEMSTLLEITVVVSFIHSTNIYGESSVKEIQIFYPKIYIFDIF